MEWCARVVKSVKIAPVVFPFQCFLDIHIYTRDYFGRQAKATMTRTHTHIAISIPCLTWYHAELRHWHRSDNFCRPSNLHELCENTNFTSSLWLCWNQLTSLFAHIHALRIRHLLLSLELRCHNTNKFSSRHLNSS